MILLALFVTLVACLWTGVWWFAKMQAPKGAIVGASTLKVLWLVVLFVWAVYGIEKANAADLALPRLPYEITHGYSRAPLGTFGTYSNHYLHRRWARMCKGAARYQAMGEAYEMGRPQPCR